MKVFIHWSKNQFKWQIKTLIIWSLILGAMSLLVGWAFQPFSESGYFELVQNLPEYMKQAFLGEEGVATSLEGFLRLEYFSWMGLMFAFFPFINGSSAIAGDIENKTLEPLFSKPISRDQFYWGKFIVLTVLVIIFILFNFGCLWLGLKTIGHGLSFTVWYLTFFMMVLSTVFFVAVAFFFSTIFDSSRRAMTAAIGFGIFEYILQMITSAVGKSDWARWTTFYHADVTEIFKNNSFPWGSAFYILLLTVAFATAGWIVFRRKDIAG